MGIDARNSYLSVSFQQQIEASIAMGDSTTTSPNAPPTVAELFLAITAVNEKAADIERRISLLEAAFNSLLQKTTEISQELRLTQEELAVKNRILVLLENSSIDYTAILHETERVRTENMGER